MKKAVLILSFFAILFSTTSLWAQPKEITLDGIWGKYLFQPRGVPGFESMRQGDFYTMITPVGIEKYSFETGEQVEVILNTRQLTYFDKNVTAIDEYSFNSTEDKLLIASRHEEIYRRSDKAFYYIYDCKTKEIILLADTTKGKQSFATFSTDGTKVAFVRDNNLFVRVLVPEALQVEGELYVSAVNPEEEIQITRNGSDNEIKNGIADWVYEEELSLSKAFEWSPDGSKIAFLRFDESEVKEFLMELYGELYPESFRYKYPKAGEDNSLVEVHIYDLKSKRTTKLDMGDNSNCYFPRIYWLPNSTDLITLKMNRHQNKLEFIRYNTLTQKQDVVFTDENSRWLDVNDSYYFMDDSKTMFLTSERDGYNHIYKVVFGGAITQITKGAWEVADICAVNTKQKQIYYLSNESHTLNRDLYVIGFDGKKKTMLTDGKGWHRVKFSHNTNYYLDNYSDNNTPPIHAIYKNSGRQVRVLQDNAALKKRAEEYGFAKKEMFNFTTDEGVSLNGWMIKPLTFDSEKKYPVLMYVYGGPGSQEVNNSWFRGMDLAWYQMLAQKGYIVVCVDGRGTAARGDDFKKSIYKQMGKLESEDQMATARYLKTLTYVDSDRVGIWGWSFGGYLSSLAMFKGDGLFKMAMAVAPVTNWRYYDNIYTERFLQTPQENPSGYDDNSPIFHAEKLKGNYLLIHGMADDNVHYQNAVDLTTALIESNKQFTHFFYPNKNHFIVGGNTRLHLYTLLTNYVLENL